MYFTLVYKQVRVTCYSMKTFQKYYVDSKIGFKIQILIKLELLYCKHLSPQLGTHLSCLWSKSKQRALFLLKKNPHGIQFVCTAYCVIYRTDDMFSKTSNVHVHVKWTAAYITISMSYIGDRIHVFIYNWDPFNRRSLSILVLFF